MAGSGIGVAREHCQAIGHQQVDAPAAPTIAAISAHGEGGGSREVAPAAACTAGDRTASAATTAHRLGKQADSAVSEGADQATDRAADGAGTAATTTITTTAGGGPEGEVGVGTAIWGCVGGCRATLATAAADGLDQHTVGQGALCDVSAVGVEVDGTTGSAIPPVATHGEGRGQIPATCP